MILHDAYALNRKWWSGWMWGEPWVADATSKDWTEWDYRLADIFQVIEDYTDSESGQFKPFDSSGDVDWDIRKDFSGYLAEVERYRNDHKELPPGVRIYAVPVFRNPDNKPTLDSWARDLEEDKADGREAAHRNARPPTAAELKQLRESGVE